MKKLIIITALILFKVGAYAQIYKSKEDACKVHFFSATSIRNIEANNKIAVSILNTSTGDVVFQIPNIGFKFEIPLMEEHFNENYMETDKFPKSSFKGKINEKIDYSKDGEYKATATGTFSIHGQAQQKTIEGTVIVKNGEISLKAEFNIHIADYKIEIPSVVTQDIAEDVKVNIDCDYVAYVSKPSVKVGMTEDEVVKLLGEPEDRTVTTTKGGTTRMLFYNNRKTTINIGTDGKVDYINNY